MREISSSEITAAVKELFISANYLLPPDITAAVGSAFEEEKSSVCRAALKSINDNLVAAKELDLPVCQDTGMAVLFAEIGQDVHINGDFNEAVNEGVRRAYISGAMRCSVVSDPLRRVNTNDNTPAIIHVSLVKGSGITLTAAPKGFGSENMSAVKMFTPAASREDIIGFVVNTVIKAGSNPCPPITVGVGIGGTFDYCTTLAKKALIRSFDIKNSDPFYAQMEDDLLTAINATGIGAQGFGGSVTALGVNIEVFATHIAGLPVAVNMGCHVNRHKTAII